MLPLALSYQLPNVNIGNICILEQIFQTSVSVSLFCWASVGSWARKTEQNKNDDAEKSGKVPEPGNGRRLGNWNILQLNVLAGDTVCRRVP